jgi:hypothetical protein
MRQYRTITLSSHHHPPVFTHCALVHAHPKVPEKSLLRHQRNGLLSLATLIRASLEIESPLVLQPPPVIRDTTNLLAIVVRDRVRHRARRRIDTVSLDAAVKLAFFLHFCQPIRYHNLTQSPAYTLYIRANSPVPHAENRTSEKRPNQPPSSQHPNRAQSRHHQRIQTKARGQRTVVSPADERLQTGICHADRCEARRDDIDLPACAAQGEEVVPRQ